MSYRKASTESSFGAGARLLLLLNAGSRFAYGVGALLSPAAMERVGIAPDVPERPEAQLFVRAFGGHMVGVGTLGLLALRRRRLERPAAWAALAIDVIDVSSALVEAAKRGRLERDLAGGIVLSASGAISAALVLR